MGHDEYALLVLLKGERDSVMRADGTLTCDIESERASVLAKAPASHAETLRVYRRQGEDAQATADLARQATEDEARTRTEQRIWEVNRDDFSRSCRVERIPTGVRITFPSGETLLAGVDRAQRLIEKRFEDAHPRPPTGAKRHPSPTPLPEDADVLSDATVQRRECWTASLTTRDNTDREVLVAEPGPIDPPPWFVTNALNTVADEGWTVHHVAEDRAVVGNAVKVTAVRCLLRRVHG